MVASPFRLPLLRNGVQIVEKLLPFSALDLAVTLSSEAPSAGAFSAKSMHPPRCIFDGRQIGLRDD